MIIEKVKLDSVFENKGDDNRFEMIIPYVFFSRNYIFINTSSIFFTLFDNPPLYLVYTYIFFYRSVKRHRPIHKQ